MKKNEGVKEAENMGADMQNVISLVMSSQQK
jgi:hypothetical protein